MHGHSLGEMSPYVRRCKRHLWAHGSWRLVGRSPRGCLVARSAGTARIPMSRSRQPPRGELGSVPRPRRPTRRGS